MKYPELQSMMNALKPEQLKGPVGEQTYRWYQLILMAEIAGHCDQISYSYRQMLEIQRRKLGIEGKAKVLGTGRP